MPYAIGRTIDPEFDYGLTIRTGTEHIGEDIIELLFSDYGLSVEGTYYDVIDGYGYDVDGLEYEKKDDGTTRYLRV